MNRVSVSAHSRRPSSKHEAQKQFVREKTAQLKSENEAARRPVKSSPIERILSRWHNALFAKGAE
jgi:hypothetical protein